MKYQILVDNQLQPITEDQFDSYRQTDESLFGGGAIHLSDCKEILTIIPFTNIRYVKPKNTGEYQTGVL